jgi:chemotaxis signal transduction protein
MDEGCGPACNDELTLLVFTLGGVRMAVDTAQIYGMAHPEDVEIQGRETLGLHQLISFRGPVSYKATWVLQLKDEAIPYGVMIDQPEEIVPVNLDTLQPLPQLVRAGGGSEAIWGATVRADGTILLLVDLYKLPKDAARIQGMESTNLTH